MKIVITNTAGLNGGHIAELERHADVEIFEKSSEQNIVSRLRDADIAVVCGSMTPLTKEIVSQLPQLKFISLNTTGYDTVEREAIESTGVIVSNIPRYSTDATAELAVGLMFDVSRKISRSDSDMRVHPFEVPGTEKINEYCGMTLRGKTLGVVGLGNIGKRVVEIGKCLGMNVVTHSKSGVLDNVRSVSFDELLQSSDIISLHVPFRDELRNLFTTDSFGKMKSSALFINTARGELVDHTALTDALNSEKIAGAGLDVIYPVSKDNPIFGAKNTVITPHIGFNTHESVTTLGELIVENIKAYLAGKPINVINA